jgi:hypothetical protein
VMLLGIAGGVLALVLRSDEESPTAAAPASAALQVESDPPGAAISLGGEPTGLKTPATLRARTASQLVIRVELTGYRAVTETVAVPATGSATKRFTLSKLED